MDPIDLLWEKDMQKPRCWCGLTEEQHDGRELDISNRLHRFNEPQNPTQKAEDFGETGPRPRAAELPPGAPLPAPQKGVPSQFTTSQLLLRLKRFLDSEIIRAAQYGQKIPGGIVNKAAGFSAEISKILEVGP